ncbi:oocyte zinc finger protein XlCOF26 isoform X1 [Folsomia candida]|uniref:oocyte zinc finger protein XlCOF26 isoform X1 n=1 Tax=Folsomia candida TaxID=158441 RepID=UPI000B8F74B5|nr:oocyte zinc finger protein XlCOF26 isoform X1 [Folsomia candida]
MDLKPDKKWDCSKGSKAFKSNYELTDHLVMNAPDANVKCEVCNKVFKNRRNLSAHLRRLHSNRKRPSCDTCHRELSTPANLRRHIDSFHSASEAHRFLCTFPGCEKTYQHIRSLLHHVRIEHAENAVRHSCKLCGKDFKTRPELEQHIPTHTTEKPYNCATCGKSFAHRGTMKGHEKTHLEKSARKVLQCHVCPQTFISKEGLRLHIRVVHENQKNYPCTLCDKRFSKSSNLKGHVEARHATNKELVHSCDKCEYKSHSKQYLAVHTIRHDAPRYGCYFCGKKLFTSRELVSHFRVHTLEMLKCI